MSEQPSSQRLNSAELTRIQLQCFEAMQVRIRDMELRKYAMEITRDMIGDGAVLTETDIIKFADDLYRWLVNPDVPIEIKITT